MHTENQIGGSQCNIDSAPLANSAVVYETHAVVNRSTNGDNSTETDVDNATQNHDTPTSRQSETNSMSCVRKMFREQGLSRQTVSILMSSWRSSTKKQYQSYINRWFQYCSKRKVDYVRPNLNQVLEFLTVLFETGLSYSSLNTARGALSALGITIQNHLIGRHPLIIRYLKGVFNLRPSIPRYNYTWDVNKVLTYLRKLSPVKYLSLKDLTLKLCMLIALTNAARIQSIHLLCVHSVKKFSSEFICGFDDLLKQSRPGYKDPLLTMKAYPPDRRLCTYLVMKEYLSRTKNLRGNHSKLFISYVKPHKEVTKDTISRWIKTVMARSGVNTNVFGAHSVRSASSSKAYRNKVPIKDILEKAGWSNASTFARFYKKPIDREDTFVTGVFQ